MKKLMFSGAGLVLIAIAFLAFNMFSSLALTNARLDLTEQKLYTLSEGSKSILENLDEPINLHFFFSDKAAKDLVALRNYAKRVEEMLRDYERASGGKIKLSIVDPEPFSESEDRAAAFGLQAVPLNQSGDKLYFGLAGTNAVDDTQVIGFFQPDQKAFLEYELSRLVQTLAKPERPVVGVLSGLQINGGFNMMTQQPTPAWMIMDQIRQQFAIESLSADVEKIPDNVSVLMLIHPKDLPEQTLYAIDQFVLKGGKLLAFVDPYSEADTGMGMPGELPDRASSLEPLFKAWGIELLTDKVVGDGAYGMAVGMGQGQAPVRHVGWLNLPGDVLDQDDVTTQGLDTLTFASAGILQALEGASTRFTPLVQSSTQAMPFAAQRLGVLNNPGELIRELVPTGDAYTLAARVQGPAQSAFPEGLGGQAAHVKDAQNINLIVVADSDILSDRMWVQVQDFFGQRIPQPWADNAGFAINALDNLAGSDALISVRSRGRFSRPFVVVDSLQREAEARFRQKEETLQARLAQTEQQLAALQKNDDPTAAFEITPEQQKAIQGFVDEKLKIRKELREVQYQLNADIEALGRTLKVINIALVPIVLTLAVLALWWVRRRRS